jgi:hypothetical protein
MYRAPPSSSAPSSIYPKIGPHPSTPAPPRPLPYQHNPNPSSSSPSRNSLSYHASILPSSISLFELVFIGYLFFFVIYGKHKIETKLIALFVNFFAVGLGIKVAIKPEFRIAPPVRS